MNWHIPAFLAFLAIGAVSAFETEAELLAFLNGAYETEASQICKTLNDAEWEFATDVNNKEKEQHVTDVTIASAQRRKELWKQNFENLEILPTWAEETRRQVKVVKLLGNAALEEADLKLLTETQNYMTSTYSAAKICPFEKQDCADNEKLSLEPGIEEILSTSVNYDELTYVWTKWRKETGERIRASFGNYVDLSNKAAIANGFEDKGKMWQSDYESDTFVADMDALWAQVEPLYNELHKFVMKRLKERYGDKIDVTDGMIPAHVFGNMWAQSWVALSDLAKPYPLESKVNVTEALLTQEYSVKKMFETSDTFYKSMGLIDNAVSYGDDSMIEKPADRDVLCHASAWDFCDKTTYRIKMCTNVNSEDFVTVHHEMGHIQYFLQYKDQPYAFRTGANPGFHEAVGDTIALSVATPRHLQAVGLLENYEDTDEASINALMDMALERVAFLPFGLLIDKWRWDVFSNAVSSGRWNAHWWTYRNKYQKVKPPVSRSEIDFDPGAKYHVAGDSQYINYFVAHILEFQLYRALCIKAGQFDPENAAENPLHKCDFYEKTEAGDALAAGLKLGASKHWKEALQAMTGENDLSAAAIMEYFAPLLVYLKAENEKR